MQSGGSDSGTGFSLAFSVALRGWARSSRLLHTLRLGAGGPSQAERVHGLALREHSLESSQGRSWGRESLRQAADPRVGRGSKTRGCEPACRAGQEALVRPGCGSRVLRGSARPLSRLRKTQRWLKLRGLLRAVS